MYNTCPYILIEMSTSKKFPIRDKSNYRWIYFNTACQIKLFLLYTIESAVVSINSGSIKCPKLSQIVWDFYITISCAVSDHRTRKKSLDSIWLQQNNNYFTFIHNFVVDVLWTYIGRIIFWWRYYSDTSCSLIRQFLRR